MMGIPDDVQSACLYVRQVHGVSFIEEHAG
jgi:hypothetical protein